MPKTALSEKIRDFLEHPWLPWFGLLLLWSGWLFHPRLYQDEGFYIRAFQAVQQGRSPYSLFGYLYPPPLAYLGSTALSFLGYQATLSILRLLNLLAGFWIVRLALQPFQLRPLPLLFVSLAAIALLPPVAHGLEVNNLSVLTAALGIAALRCWAASPWRAASLLATSLLIKPIFAVAWLLLLFYSHAHARKTALLSAAFCATCLASVGWEIPAMLHQMAHNTMQHTQLLLSWRNLCLLFGLSLPGWSIALFWSGVGIFWLRLRHPNPAQLESIAILLSLYSLPLVWDHTLTTILPMMMAVCAYWLHQRPVISTSPTTPATPISPTISTTPISPTTPATPTSPTTPATPISPTTPAPSASWPATASPSLVDPSDFAPTSDAAKIWLLRGIGLFITCLALLFSDRLGDMLDLPYMIRAIALATLIASLGFLAFLHQRSV